MNSLKEEQRAKIKLLIEKALAPLNGVVASFDNVMVYNLRTGYGDEPWKESVLIVYPVRIMTNIGEKCISLRILNHDLINDVASAIHEFVYEKDIPGDVKDKILSLIYPPGFLKTLGMGTKNETGDFEEV